MDYRKLYVKVHGTGPWVCSECDEAILEMGRTKGCGIIHHIDHDRTNNDIKNLTAVHQACHIRHHRGGVTGNRLGSTNSAQQRKAQSERMKGRPAAHGYTEAVIAKSKATRAANGKPHVEAMITCECGKVCHAGPMKRHTNRTGHSEK